MTETPRSSVLESRVLSIVLMGVGALLLLVAVVQLPLSISSRNTRPGSPWALLRFDPRGMVVAPMPNAPPGELREGDIIVSIDGVMFDSTATLLPGRFSHLLAARAIGDTLEVEYLRGDRRLRALVRLERSMADIAGPVMSIGGYMINIVAPLSLLLIAYIVLLRRQRTRQSTLLFLLSASISTYLLGMPLITMAQVGEDIRVVLSFAAELCLLLFFPLLLHFLLVFPEERTIRGSVRLRNAAVYVPFLALIIYLAVLWFGDVYTGYEPLIELPVLIGYGASPFIGAGILIYAWRRSASQVTKNVVRTILAGVLTFGAASVSLLLLNATSFDAGLGIELGLALRFLVIGLLTFSMPVAFSWAMLRYGFLDVKILFRRSATYALLTVALAVLFGAATFTTGTTFEQSGGADLLSMIFVIVVAFGLTVSLMKDRIQRFVDTRMFADDERRRREARERSRQLLTLHDRAAMLTALTGDIPALFDFSRACVVVAGDEGDVATTAGEAPPDEVLRQLFAIPDLRTRCAAETVLAVRTLRGAPEHAAVHVLMHVVQAEGGDVFVIYGEKRSGRPVSDDDLDILRGIADHAGLGWRNAAVSEELRRQEQLRRELELASSIQTALLPRAVPDHPLLDIAAAALPAREIGGDFYDFYDTSDGGVGVIVGDVSDKGVSAAMVMASAVSTLRFAAELDSEPREVLARANERLRTDTRRHMFVAAFVGTISADTRLLTFSNAGLPKPLLVRDDEAFLLEWSDNGAHIPLGMRRDVHFHQQELELAPGDILVITSDGVTEAANPEGEEFGVKRLRDVVRRNSRGDAAAILDAVRTEVRIWTGDQDAHDDVTLVVIVVSPTR